MEHFMLGGNKAEDVSAAAPEDWVRVVINLLEDTEQLIVHMQGCYVCITDDAMYLAVMDQVYHRLQCSWVGVWVQRWLGQELGGAPSGVGRSDMWEGTQCDMIQWGHDYPENVIAIQSQVHFTTPYLAS